MAFNIIQNSEKNIANLKLREAYSLLFANHETRIPFIVWFLENPDSPLRFPGQISLYNHDILHILLGRGISSQDEAFVIGFTMGNDVKVSQVHVVMFKFFAKFLYPDSYKFSALDMRAFDLGFIYGRKIKIKQINEINFEQYQNDTVDSLRKLFCIKATEIQLLRQFESWLIPDSQTSRELIGNEN